MVEATKGDTTRQNVDVGQKCRAVDSQKKEGLLNTEKCVILFLSSNFSRPFVDMTHRGKDDFLLGRTIVNEWCYARTPRISHFDPNKRVISTTQ